MNEKFWIFAIQDNAVDTDNFPIDRCEECHLWKNWTSITITIMINPMPVDFFDAHLLAISSGSISPDRVKHPKDPLMWVFDMATTPEIVNRLVDWCDNQEALDQTIDKTRQGCGNLMEDLAGFEVMQL